MKYQSSFLALSLLFFSCHSSNTVSNERTTSVDKFRPQFHFTPPSMWMNDPNGMVYYEGEYHLFYQHNPDSIVWGPMHWGHAVSKDMINWEHLPIGLYPDDLGTIFSGSAVVDWNNTSGLGTADNPPMVAIFTYHNAKMAKEGKDNYQTQGIAFSTDKGRTWEKYQDNPVLENPGIKDFRDPKVMWYEDGQKWIMALAVKDNIRFYSSSNLTDWELESNFGKGIGAHGGVWECPDLFELPVQGTEESKWVLLVSINPGGPNGGSATQYFIGDFDGKNFIIDEDFKADLGEEGLWIDYGRDNYAGVTWSGIPENDGRRLFIGWMSNWDYANVVPTEFWRSAMTIARELSLQKTDEGIRVISQPVDELDNIYAAGYELKKKSISENLDMTGASGIRSATLDVALELEIMDPNTAFALELSNDHGEKLIVGYDPEKNSYFLNRDQAGPNIFSDKFEGIQYGPRFTSNRVHSLRLLFDVASVELFADGGQTVMTTIFFPDEYLTQLHLKVNDGTVQINSGKIYQLD